MKESTIPQPAEQVIPQFSNLFKASLFVSLLWRSFLLHSTNKCSSARYLFLCFPKSCLYLPEIIGYHSVSNF
jgi:hypothetical protein